MKYILRIILGLSKFNSFFRVFFIRFFCYINNYSYLILGVLAREESLGIHPKINIIDYIGWFSSHICNNDVVLDVGSNRGHMAAQLATVAKEVIAIEIDKRYHDEAIQSHKAENLRFINADATKFSIKDIGLIDVVTLSNVLEHIEHRTEFLLSLKNNISWKRKVGRVLIRVPSIERDWLPVYKLKNGIEHRLDRTHYIEYTEAQLKEELNEAGFTILDFTMRWGEFYVCCEVLA